MRMSPYRSPFYLLFFAYVAGLLWAEVRLDTLYPLVCEPAPAWPWGYMATAVLLAVIGLGLAVGMRQPVGRMVVAVALAVVAGYGSRMLAGRAEGGLPADCMDGRKRSYWVEVLDAGKESRKSWKKTVRVLAVREDEAMDVSASGGGMVGAWRPMRAKLCLYFQKEERAAALAPGDRLAVYAAPRPLDDSAFAGYARYLRRRHVYATAYVPHSGWQPAEGAAGVGRHPARALRRAAGRLQARMVAGLDHPNLGERERGIAKALIFGEKSDMDPEVSQAYRHAGVVHVLCVSGMHLGVVAMLLVALSRGLARVRGGRWIRWGLLCVFLWGYALLTGLSASVCRAACMFTFVQAGLCFGRRLPVERSLALSAWLLLLLRPDWVADLGFLLSYLAVWGIVWLTPKTFPPLLVRCRPVAQVTRMGAVSWAAQCATGPLCIRSFGQFPLYFGVANLLVAPVASVVLPLGLALSLARLVPSLADSTLVGLLMTGLHYGIAWMNGVSLWIERWPGAVWTVGLSWVACMSCYLILLIGRRALMTRDKRGLPYIGLLLWLSCVLA